MKEPRTNQVSARITDKAYKKMRAVADKREWSESQAINKILEDAKPVKKPRKAKS